MHNQCAGQTIPRANLPTIRYSLRYPGQVDDGNGLFYNFNRFFYEPLAGPIQRQPKRVAFTGAPTINANGKLLKGALRTRYRP